MDQLTPPLRYGCVNPGVHRGSFPTLRNYRFLSRLQVKTIISLTPESPNADLISFSEMAGATIMHFSIVRTTNLTENLANTLISAINVMLKYLQTCEIIFIYRLLAVS